MAGQHRDHGFAHVAQSWLAVLASQSASTWVTARVKPAADEALNSAPANWQAETS